MNTKELAKYAETSEFASRLREIYQDDNMQTTRYREAIASFEEMYGSIDGTALFSSAGRTEILGNHTDHNNGLVFAASVSLDVIAVAAKTDDNTVRIKSCGFDEDCVSLGSLGIADGDNGTSQGLIKGIIARIKEMGYAVGGFCAYTTSNVIKGSGLSSSAAFETLVGTIIDNFFCGGKIGSVEVAKIGRYAENVFFGKPCGLMDQVACAYGGGVVIDFKNPEPEIEKIELKPEKYGYETWVIDVRADHAALTDEYAAIPAEMKKVALLLGGEVLRGYTLDDLLENASLIRDNAGDRAFLRALHFVRENDRVETAAAYVRNGDFEGFLKCINESGESSLRYLQNIYPSFSPATQAMTIGYFICDNVMHDRGAYRVHGGGFAGTMLVFCPAELSQELKGQCERVFGSGACHKLRIRSQGAFRVI